MQQLVDLFTSGLFMWIPSNDHGLSTAVPYRRSSDVQFLMQMHTTCITGQYIHFICVPRYCAVSCCAVRCGAGLPDQQIQ